MNDTDQTFKTMTDKLNASVHDRVERFAKDWIAAAQGVDWTEKFQETLREVVSLREQLQGRDEQLQEYKDTLERQRESLTKVSNENALHREVSTRRGLELTQPYPTAEAYELVCKARNNLQSEVEKLKRIIAKELTENDELGSEFVYVNALKEQLAEAQKEIEHAQKVNLADLRRYESQIQAQAAQIASLRDVCQQAVTAQTNMRDLSGPVHRIKTALAVLEEKALSIPLSVYEERVRELIDCAKFYAAQAGDSIWDLNRFISFDKFGGVCKETSGPYVAQAALKAFEGKS